MTAPRRLFAIVLVLVLVTGQMALAALVTPMIPAAGQGAALGVTAMVGLDRARDCPDRGATGHPAPVRIVCHDACSAGAMLLPEAVVPVKVAAEAFDLQPPARPAGTNPHPEPLPPKATVVL